MRAFRINAFRCGTQDVDHHAFIVFPARELAPEFDLFARQRATDEYCLAVQFRDTATVMAEIADLRLQDD